jgi:hypothetical protein
MHPPHDSPFSHVSLRAIGILALLMSLDAFKKFNTESFCHEEDLFAKYNFISSFGDEVLVQFDDESAQAEEDICSDTCGLFSRGDVPSIKRNCQKR